MRLTKLYREFFESEKTGGILLVICTLLSLALANSAIGEHYYHIWHADLGGKPVEFWINDGLMAIFFLLIGLEIEREIYVGELSSVKNAMLPMAAAIGGAVVPAAIHFGLNHGTPYQDGLGIPMATDIAFSLGILSLLGNRVSNSLKIFLTAMAIIDDLLAIIIIAIFYSKGFSLGYFSLAMLVFGLLILLNRLNVTKLWVYLSLGAVMWYFMLHSGVHATITGVLLAFTIPFRKTQKKSSPSYKLQHALHVPAAFIILPLFALANTGIMIPADWASGLSTSNSLGIAAGLVLGKPLGIVAFSLLAVAIGICSLPRQIRKKHLVGVGLLAGIGFTMSIFITILAFDDPIVVVHSKIAILVASLLAGGLGYLILHLSLPKRGDAETAD